MQPRPRLFVRRRRVNNYLSGLKHGFGIILQNYPREWFGPIDDHIIGEGRFRERESVRRKRFDIDLPGMQQLLKGFHVAFFGPADIFDRIIDALVLVVQIVTSGTIGTRHFQCQFLR